MSKQRPNTTLLDLLNTYKQDIFYRFNCHRVGVVQAIDTTNKTATIQLIDKRVISTSDGDVFKDYSLLVDCPIVMQRNAKGGVTIPLSIGDNCLILFNDRDLDNWYESGVQATPNTSRSHHLSDGIVLPTLFSSANAEAFTWNNEATELIYEDTVISLDSKVGISNASESLKDILNELITALKALQVVDPVSGNLSITGATDTALDAVNTKINGLMK